MGVVSSLPRKVAYKGLGGVAFKGCILFCLGAYLLAMIIGIYKYQYAKYAR